MTRRIVLLLVAALLTALVGARAYLHHKDLSETLDWMARTYNPRDDGWGGKGSSVTKCMAHCETEGPLVMTETLSYKGCQLTTFSKSNNTYDKGLWETFNLGDIDPDSVAMREDELFSGQSEREWIVAFKARNDAQVLYYSGNISNRGIQSRLQINDAEYGARFTKAFKHAIELCGGRPSKF